MILSFHPCFMADHQIILGDRLLEPDDMGLIRQARAILLPQGCSYDLYMACKTSPGLLFPNYDMRFNYPGKVGQSLFFKALQVPHPVTMPWSSVAEFRVFLGKGGALSHGRPFLIKADGSHEGEGIFLTSDPESLETALATLERWEKSGQSGFVSQEVVSSRGNVLRAVIMGREVITYWKRPEEEGQMITTVSRNALVDKEWRPDLQEKAVLQARRFSETSGINLAALDFVFPLDDPDPQPLILEVNYYFGRRGLGGSLAYYRMLYRTIHQWLLEQGMDPSPLSLV